MAVLFATTACGPSLRRVHRASAYFEECYAADLDRAVPDAERRACWQAWRRAYRVGATPERLDYVHERLAMLDPDRAAAIALSTGDDGSVDTIDVGGEVESEGEGESEVGSESEGESEVEVPSVADGESAPTPSEAAPPDTSDAEWLAEERHQRSHERHLHRGIVAPRTLTPRCPCEADWQACSSSCLADERGCIGACRREFTLCSRSCY